jgi:hypothetical protein
MDEERAGHYGYAIAAMILVVFAIITSEAIHVFRIGRLLEDARDELALLEQRHEDFTHDVGSDHLELARMEERAAAAAATKAEWEAAVRRMMEIREFLPRIRAESARLRDGVSNELARLRVVRASDYFPSFALANGRVFHSVKFYKIVPEGLKIQHRDGMTTVRAAELPEHYRRAWGFDVPVPQERVGMACTEPPAREIAAARAAGNMAAPEARAEDPAPTASEDGETRARRLDAVGRLRRDAERFRKQAEGFDAKAREHDGAHTRARLAGHASGHPAEASKARAMATDLRAKASRLENQAAIMENPPP